MKKINHTRLFLHALRTALLFVAGFFIYEILVALEELWNEAVPENSLQHFHQRKGIKLIINNHTKFQPIITSPQIFFVKNMSKVVVSLMTHMNYDYMRL